MTIIYLVGAFVVLACLSRMGHQSIISSIYGPRVTKVPEWLDADLTLATLKINQHFTGLNVGKAFYCRDGDAAVGWWDSAHEARYPFGSEPARRLQTRLEQLMKTPTVAP